MSRRIEESHPFSKEDREYLLSRAGGLEKIDENDRRFAHLNEEQKESLSQRGKDDEAKEAEIRERLEKQAEKDEEESYHPDDVAEVNGLTISKLRQRLEAEGLRSTVTAEDKRDPDDPEDALTEKEVLTYRLLNYLDDRRKKLSDLNVR